MSLTKITQGNWHHKDGQIYPEETGKTLALIPYFDENNEEHKANAELIAQAPRLLKENEELKRTIKAQTNDVNKFNSEWLEIRTLNAELLEALKFIVNDMPEAGEDAILSVTGYNKACAAIAKAEGV